MSAFIDFSTGAGLASSTGVRPYLPALLAGALARGDIGIDFGGTNFDFLESTAFLGVLVVIAAAAFLLERADAHRRGADPDARAGRGPVEIAAGAMGVVLGALLFGGALADGGYATLAGILLGPVCAALGWFAVGGLIERVRARIERDQAALLTAYADAAALFLAAIAIFVPPLALLGIPVFIVLLLGGRRRDGEKYAGLRILR
jgi:hypothetical protein